MTQSSLIVSSANQEVSLPILKEKEIRLSLKREDLIHPLVSGNKFRKLKYNLLEAHALKKETLLTFGGAFSNHISATAAAGRMAKLNTIGIIRGEELSKKVDQNPTLSFAKQQGMKLQFVSRADYRKKHTQTFIKHLQVRYGDFYLLPEGGTNKLAIKGCAEILTQKDTHFTHICCPVGTGGTIAGIINNAQQDQKIIGFSALKESFLNAEIDKFVRFRPYQLIREYHFGGYAKLNKELITFINEFKNQTNILLDPIYTGKMCYGIMNLIQRDFFPKGSNILAIHTGGLQGIAGINQLLKSKKWPTLNYP